MSADWKVKYLDIRAKLKEATDVAYRLGMEAGLKQGAQQAQMQAMQQQQQMQQQMMQGGQPGAEGDPSQGGMPPGADQGGMPPGMEGGGDEQGMEGGAPPPEEMGDAGGGSELDGHIAELEGLVSKGEKPTVLQIRKAVESIAALRKSQKNVWQKKMDKIIPAQKSVVDSILKKWENEAKKPSENIEALIKQHGLKIGE